jgi:hypothetical protein
MTDDAQDLIKLRANEKNDFDLRGRIDDYDLAAKECRYHESCRRGYTRANPNMSCTTDVDLESGASVGNLSELKAAYDSAFQSLCHYIQLNLFQKKQIERLSMLRQHYLSYMEVNFPHFHNPQHTAQKLKHKLVSHFGDKLRFWLPQSVCKSELVFSASLDIGEAVEAAFNASSSETAILKQAASILRRNIKDEFSQSPMLSWPPSVETLLSMSSPKLVTDFIIKVIAGNKESSLTDHKSRLASSIAEDISSAATNGRWTMPKHMLIGMSLRHLTRNVKVISIANRYGHCAPYTKLVDLEDALAVQVQKSGDLLPTNISSEQNRFCHFCWDNFDLLEETPSGSGTSHYTHGIAIQEVSSTKLLTVVSDPQETGDESNKCVKKKRFVYIPPPLPMTCKITKVEPAMKLHTVAPDQTTVDGPVRGCSHDLLVRSVCRAFFNMRCTVPDWTGWVSMTAEEDSDATPSNIGYMTPIFQSITEYTTIRQCLLNSIEASNKLKQNYTFVTFDLAAAKLAYAVAWNDPEQFGNVVIHLGAFHTICSFLGSLGKMVAGSGFEDLLIDSGICASGSIAQVMNGKHYNRALRVHCRMLDYIAELK